MPQNPTFDPDKFLQERGSNLQVKPEAFDPDQFMAMRQRMEMRPTPQELIAPPPPKPGWGEWAKNLMLGTGKGFLDSLADPAVLTATGVGTALATAPAKVAIPAVGGAVTAVRAGQKLAREGKPLTPREMASTFISGAAGEAGGRLLASPGRPRPFTRSEIDPLGAEVGKFFGRDVSAQQLTRSPKLDFMANVARTGLGGRKGMAQLEERQSAAAIEHLSAEAAKLSPTHTNIPPTRGTPTHPVEVSPGKALQNTLGEELSKLRARSKTEYDDFLTNFGPLQEIGPEGPFGPTAGQVHARRSAALDRARDAFRAGDTKMQSQHLKEADRASARLRRILPPDAHRKYEAISGWYKEEINRLDNEMIYNLRQSTKGEDVMKSILSRRLKTYTELGDNVALDNNELFHALKRAVPPKEWKQTQAELIQEMVGESIDNETGILDHKKLAKIWTELSPESQKILTGQASGEIQRTLAVLRRAQEGTKGGPGQLAISVRQPSAMLTLAQSTMAPFAGIAAGSAAHASGFGPSASLGTAAIIASSPLIFYKALTTPFGRSLLVKAATAKGPAAEAARQALQRYLSQETVHLGKEGYNKLSNSSTEIPNPPQ